MVVTRKTPVAPAPPASRSNSSQPLPRATKQKTREAPVANNKTPTPPPAASKPSPVKKKPTRPSSSFPHRLFFLVLSVFSVYAALVCPTDFPRTSPVCRSLDAYRTYILEPYVVPPLQYLAHHTEPHLAPLKPCIAPLKPYAASTVSFTRTHVVPRVSTAASFVAGQYRTHVAPRLYWFFVTQYWNGIIKPIYFKGVHPILEPQSRPYRIYYHRFIVPFARRTAAHAQDWYIRLRPHVIHYLEQTRRYVCTVYKAVKPHVVEVYLRIRPHVVVLLEKVKVQALVVARKVGDARREYVDPHVRRIWEKVGEAEVVSSFKSSSSSSSSSFPTSLTSTPTQASAEEPTPAAVSPSSIPVSVDTTPIVEPTPVVVAEVEVETSIPAPETSSEEAAIPPPSPPAPFSETPIPTTEPAAAVAASVVAASIHASELKDGDSVDDFLKAIGLGDEQAQGPDTPVSASASPAASNVEATDGAGGASPDTYGEAEPSPEERAQITAEKRAEITARHGRWQADLEVLVKEVTKNLRATLGEMRAEAVEELKRWGKEGKGVVREVEGEAEKMVKGVEAYLKGVGTKVKEGEKEKWERVLGKVQERFREKVQDVQREVHTWFVGLRDKEGAEVDSAAASVKGFADRAQGDIGLDYAWLDDVTYHDWQKYHDLMRTSENFTAAAQTIQAAVDPKGTNPLVDALNELEQAVSDVVDGFSFVIKGIRRRAEAPGGAFYEEPEPEAKSPSENETSDEDEKVSILPIESPESRSTTLPKDPPKVSATPLEDVVMGRSKEEVEANLAGIPVETPRMGREEL